VKKAAVLLLICSASLVAALAPACLGSSDGQETTDTLMGEESTGETSVDAAGEPEDAPLADRTGGYPTGPYGQEVGTVAENHTFFDPETGETVELASLFGGAKKMLLLNSSAGWCSVCKQEVVELKKKYAQYGDEGLEIWCTLFQDYAGDVPDDAFYQSWMATLKPSYPTFLDTDFQLGAYFDPDSAPMNMLIRLDTMEIVYLSTGFDPDEVEGEIAAFLE